MNFLREALDAFNNRTQAMKDFNQFAQGSLLEFQTGRAHWGNDDPVALAQRFIGWSKVLSERNATAISSSNLRLYAARGNGQSPARKEWNAIPVSKSRLDYLSTVKNVAQNPRYAAASEIEELTDHPFLRLMNQFNEFHNGTEGLSLTSIYLDLIGNSYWHIERDNMGVPVALYPLLSQYCAPVPDPEQFVKGYLYGIDPNNRKPFDRDEIIHFKLPNPNDAIIGVGRLISFWRSHDLSESYAQYEKSITDNRARPDALVSYKTGKLDPKARAELEAEWNRKFKGSGNAGKILVTDFEYDVKELGFTPAMVAALDTRRWTRNELAAAFGVPIPMIDTEGVSLANYNTALTHYGRFTIAPVLRLIEHKLNTELVSKYDDRLFCCFDNPVPEDMQFKAQQEKDRLASGAMTINEVRRSAGQSEVEWGNEPLVSAGTIPLSESIADSKKKSLNQTQKKNHASSHLVATKDSERPEDGEQVNNPNANDGEVDELTPTQKKLAKRIRQFLLEVIDEMLSRLDSESTDVSWISNSKWIQRAVSLTREFVGLELETGFDGEREATGVALGPWIDLPEAQKFIDDQTFKFVQSMNNKTQADFKRQLQKGIDAGESIPQLTKRMEKVFEGYPQQKRAELIARTESARAIMAGKEQAWIQSGVVTHKVWDSQNDSCPFCLAMEGKSVSLGEPWFVEGETMVVEFRAEELKMKFDYGPVLYPPLHPNCRCSMKGELRGDFETQIPETKPAVAEGQFVPAENVEEALERISQFTRTGQARNYSEQEIELEQANAVLEGFDKVYASMDEKALDVYGVSFMDDEQIVEMGAPSGISAAINFETRMMYVNIDNFNNEKIGRTSKFVQTIEKLQRQIARQKRKLEALRSREIPNLERIEAIKAAIRQLEKRVADAQSKEDFLRTTFKQARWGVPENMVDVVVHELGHIMHSTLESAYYEGEYLLNPPDVSSELFSEGGILNRVHLDKLRKKFAKNISQYANTNYKEYFAESFTAWFKDEEIKTELKRLFERYKSNDN